MMLGVRQIPASAMHLKHYVVPRLHENVLGMKFRGSAGKRKVKGVSGPATGCCTGRRSEAPTRSCT